MELDLIKLLLVTVAGWVNRKQQAVIDPAIAANGSGPIQRRKRVGGILCFYRRKAA